MTPPFREAPLAFLLFGVFTGFEEIFDRVRELITRQYGSLHPRGESPVYPFPDTETYRPSMGPDLLRRFFVMDRLWPQDGLAAVKRRAVEMEDEIRSAGRYPVARPVNIDPGIINDCRIILATTKDYSHRIYRGEGIWEEITLIFQHGEYRALPWTYRDFRSPAYHEFFTNFRSELLERLHRRPSAPPSAPQA